MAKFAIYKLIDFWNPGAERGPHVFRVLYGLGISSVLWSWRSGVGLICSGGEPRSRWAFLILLLILFHSGMAAIFTGGGKARMPIEPLLVLLAGGGVALMLSYLANRWHLTGVAAGGRLSNPG